MQNLRGAYIILAYLFKSKVFLLEEFKLARTHCTLICLAVHYKATITTLKCNFNRQFLRTFDKESKTLKGKENHICTLILQDGTLLTQKLAALPGWE